jgi:molybdopterin-guanine dinucleotide biosynthesis protein A
MASAAILAGGRASRFGGRDKSALGHLLSYAQDRDVVVPWIERGYHPLCAVYTRGCGAAVARRLAEGPVTMTGLFEEVRVHAVTSEELDAFGNRHRLLANVNTPAECEEIETLAGHGR